MAVFLTIKAIVVDGEDFLEKISKLVGLRTFIERRIGERRHTMNFVSGLLLAEEEAVKVSAFIAKLPTYLPLIQKNLADLQKAAADKSDPTALIADTSDLLTDLSSDLAVLQTVAPALTPTAPASAS